MKEKKFKITVTETQLLAINEALDTYSRICCGQLDEWSIWERLEEVVKKDKSFYRDVDVSAYKDNIRQVKRRYLGEGAGYNASPFVGNCYQMYKTFRHHLHKESGRTDWCTDSSPDILPSGTEPRPTIKTIKTI